MNMLARLAASCDPIAKCDNVVAHVNRLDVC